MPSISSAPASRAETDRKPAVAGSGWQPPPGAGTGKPVAQGVSGALWGEGDGGSAASAAETAETLQQRYLGEHFTYIRDLIGKKLRYPRQAIRMGWSGRAIVTFLVLVDGRVAELRVARSSGCSLLDADALETVRRAAPFPHPPVSARLLIPVDYVLE